MVFLMVSMYGWGRDLSQEDPNKIGYLSNINCFLGTWRSYISIAKSKLIFQDTIPYDMIVLKVSLIEICF